MSPAAPWVLAELLLCFGQGICPAVSVAKELIEASHEVSGGLVIHLPEREESAAAAGDGEGTLEAVDALAGLETADTCVTSGEGDEFGGFEWKRGGFCGGEIAVIVGVVPGNVGAGENDTAAQEWIFWQRR